MIKTGKHDVTLKDRGFHGLSWTGFTRRHLRLIQLLQILSLILILIALSSFFLHLHWGSKNHPSRISSPISFLQDDHPLNQLLPPTTPSLRSLLEDIKTNEAADNGSSSTEKRAHRFFRAATAAAAQGGVVLQWSDATIRMLRGAGTGEVFFLFYDPSLLPELPDDEKDPDPLKIFKKLAEEDREEQLLHQLPFVAVPKHEMHQLSFFLPEKSEKDLPLAMIVRLDSGWTKFPAPSQAPLDLVAMKTFLSSYRKGEVAPLLRTEPIPLPPEPPEMIETIVALNFPQKILEQTKYDALVLLYANWCGHCRRFQSGMMKLAERFDKISSINFFKMDVSRNDVPVPGLRVERVPHVVFFSRAPEEELMNEDTTDLSIKDTKSTQFSADVISSARASSASARSPDGVSKSSWFVGKGNKRKKLITFSHAEPDVLAYGEDFLLKHAACRSIDIDNGNDCNSVEGKDDTEL